MEILILTGLSGAGKSSAVNVLEDLGYYCVENIPPSLLPKFIEICMQSQGKIDRVVIVIDLRGGREMFSELFDYLAMLPGTDLSYKVLFLDCADEVIVRRQKESRRRHPLQDEGNGTIQEAIDMEREMLLPARERADILFDTTDTSTTELRERLTHMFSDQRKDSFLVRCISFGYKHGLPGDADLVFDLRFLPNPFYVEELHYLTGLDEPVRDYVMQFPQAREALERLYLMLDFLLPHYRSEGKTEVVIAVGCTGGKHRSVVFSEKLYQHFLDQNLRVYINHRDIKR